MTSTLALEIHDAGLLAVGEPGSGPDEPVESPGYALLDGRTVVTGRQAVDRARLKPRFVHRRFWQDLDTAPLARPFPRELSAADLAHAHLGGFWRSLGSDAASVILTVPGTFDEARLGLLLGIARACEVPVAGMVDAAVAAASGFAAPRILHLDAHLHRLVATELSRGGNGDVVRRRLETADDAGLVAVRDALARRFARLFVHATRFDPTHSAASEQELYRRLPDWIEALGASESVEISMATASGEAAIEASRGDLVPAVEPFCARALELVGSLKPRGERAALLVSHRLAALPGFEARLGGLDGVDWTVLGPGASAAGALRARDAIVAGELEDLTFVLRLPAAADAVAVAPREAPRQREDRRAPTHLVRDGLAYPLAGRPFLATAPWDRGGDGKAPSCKVFLDGGTAVAEVGGTAAGSAVAEVGGTAVYLNGREICGRVTLAVGDRLTVGAGERRLELQLVAVVE